MNRNKFELAGHLGQDPQVNEMEQGKKVAVFWVAEKSWYYDKDDNRKETTQWHKVEAWNKMADKVSEKLKKGDNVFIDGRVKYHEWENAEGAKKNSTTVIVEGFSVI